MNYLDQTCIRARGKRKTKIAELSGLAYSTVVYTLNGKTVPSVNTLDRINAAIDVLDAEKEGK